MFKDEGIAIRTPFLHIEQLLPIPIHSFHIQQTLHNLKELDTIRLSSAIFIKYVTITSPFLYHNLRYTNFNVDTLAFTMTDFT